MLLIRQRGEPSGIPHLAELRLPGGACLIPWRSDLELALPAVPHGLSQVLDHGRKKARTAFVLAIEGRPTVVQ